MITEHDAAISQMTAAHAVLAAQALAAFCRASGEPAENVTVSYDGAGRLISIVRRAKLETVRVSLDRFKRDARRYVDHGS